MKESRLTIAQSLAGACASVPASLLIWAGLEDGSQPASWYIFGVAALLGLPWNAFFATASAFIILTLTFVQERFGVAVFGPDGVSLVVTTIGVLVLSGVIGAHINGVGLSRRWFSRETSDKDHPR